MAFLSEDLEVLAYADGYTLWAYTTGDMITEVKKPGYFDNAKDIFRSNDRIEVVADDGAFDATISTIGRVRLRRCQQ